MKSEIGTTTKCRIHVKEILTPEERLTSRWYPDKMNCICDNWIETRIDLATSKCWGGIWYSIPMLCKIYGGEWAVHQCCIDQIEEIACEEDL